MPKEAIKVFVTLKAGWREARWLRFRRKLQAGFGRNYLLLPRYGIPNT